MRPRIYNYATSKKPAELFRKDLISAMKLPDNEQLAREDYLLIHDTWKPEWEKGVQVPVNPDQLNTVPNFRLMQETERCVTNKNNHNSHADDYKLPKKYFKVELDSDMYASTYDLDLMDISWLQSLQESKERIHIREETLSKLLNTLELQYASNIKTKHLGIEFDQAVVCDVCRSPDAEDHNEMVFCDSCNICVHQACYGITSIPSGEWLCKPCKELGSQKHVSCVLCPNVGGALKPTTQPGKWAHVCCALWVPEVSFESVEEMEPITRIKQIPPSRRNMLCTVCGIKKGAPVQCSAKACKNAYHITCAFKEKFCLKALLEEGQIGVKLKSYCVQHSAEENAEQASGTGAQNSEVDLFRAGERSSFDDDSSDEFWKYIDLSQIHKEFMPTLRVDYPHMSENQHLLIIDLIFQYWKMKRYSRYGAPLIKLSANNSMEEIQQQQRNDILRLRVDLERIRNLSYMLIKREKMKKQWLTSHRDIIDKILRMADEDAELLKTKQNDTVARLLRARSEEQKNLLSKLLQLNNVYDAQERTHVGPKAVIKRLHKMNRLDKGCELNSKSNPYAKPYAGRRVDEGSLSESKVESEERLNNEKLPLRNKSIPSNSKNLAINKGQEPTERRLSKTTNEDRRKIKSKVKPTTLKFNKTLRSSAFKLRKALTCEKETLAQENFRSPKVTTRRKLAFSMTKKKIYTRAQMNHTIH